MKMKLPSMFCLLMTILQQIMVSTGDITCRDENNKPVDWFILYKMPDNSGSSTVLREGFGYFYLDVNNQKWVLGSSSMNESQQAVGYTLQQIYESSSQDIMYALYNDETPFGKKSSSHGHTKGVFASDKSKGFWLVHSLPNFPHPTKYIYPHSGKVNGQTFLCITQKYNDMDNIGDLLTYTYPLIYNHSLPTSYAEENPNLKKVLQNSRYHISAAPWNVTHVLTTVGGQKFQAFSKFSKYDAEIYSAWIAPYYESNLCVETWQNGRGKLNSNCTGQYKVYNNEEVEISGSGTSIKIKETKDHSKWAITVDNPKSNILCIGGINRAEEQTKRGGGTVCMDIPNVYKAFNSMLRTKEECPGKLETYWNNVLNENVIIY